MSDLITLNCPSCGGKLQVNPKATTLVCEHCGTEHMVHRDGDAVTLESFARCPRCNRNDRAEKVSAIMSSQTQNIDSQDWRTEVYITPTGQRASRQVPVPKVMKQMSELAMRLTPPEKPNPIPKPRLLPYPNRKSNALLIIGIILLVVSALMFAGTLLAGMMELFEDTGMFLICLAPSLLAILAGIVLTVLGIINHARVKNKYQQAWSFVARRNRDITQKWKETNDKRMSGWQRAMDRWDSLYYCHRDDCVFIPEEGTYAQLAKMKDYLFEE
jgi:predicted RNA-binding Zn-ribbon protein involved in translation (DUF1610 family)